MFCYQCEQIYRSDEGAGCAGSKGMCGKDAATSDLQDMLLHVCEGIGQYLNRPRALGATDVEADRFVLYAFFTTLTNVNFNTGKFVQVIQHVAWRLKVRMRQLANFLAFNFKNDEAGIFKFPNRTKYRLRLDNLRLDASSPAPCWRRGIGLGLFLDAAASGDVELKARGCCSLSRGEALSAQTRTSCGREF